MEVSRGSGRAASWDRAAALRVRPGPALAVVAVLAELLSEILDQLHTVTGVATACLGHEPEPRSRTGFYKVLGACWRRGFPLSCSFPGAGRFLADGASGTGTPSLEPPVFPPLLSPWPQRWEAVPIQDGSFSSVRRPPLRMPLVWSLSVF